MNAFLPTIFYSTLAGAATLLGLALVLWKESWTRRNSIYLISLAAGVMLVTAFFHLLPESVKLAQKEAGVFLSPYFFLMLGFAVLYVFEQAVIIHACTEEECDIHSFGIVSAFGILIHSLLDGMIIGIGFEVDYKIGLISTLAVLLHELPEGIFTFSILLSAKISVKKSVLYTVFVALATPVGAVITHYFAQDISMTVLAYIIAFTAGTFFYIGASDLLPQTHRISRKANVPLVILGGFFVMLLSIFLNS